MLKTDVVLYINLNPKTFFPRALSLANLFSYPSPTRPCSSPSFATFHRRLLLTIVAAKLLHELGFVTATRLSIRWSLTSTQGTWLLLFLFLWAFARFFFNRYFYVNRSLNDIRCFDVWTYMIKLFISNSAISWLIVLLTNLLS